MVDATPPPQKAKPAAPTSRPVPPAKKKRGCFLPIFFFVLLAVAISGGYVSVQYPDTVARWTGWQPPVWFVRSGQWVIGVFASEPAEPSAPTSEISEPVAAEEGVSNEATIAVDPTAVIVASEVTTTEPQADVASTVAATGAASELDEPLAAPSTPTAAYEPAMPPLQILIDQMQTQQEQLFLLQNQMTGFEQRLNSIAAQLITAPQSTQNNFALQLELIQLALRYSGDTRAAAAALRRTAAAAIATGSLPPTTTAEALESEASRIEQITPRRELLLLLHAIRESATNPSTPAAEQPTGMTDRLLSLVNFETASEHARETLPQLISRLEIYLLAGQEDAYWTLLSTSVRANPPLEDAFKQIFAYGKPDYQLHL